MARALSFLCPGLGYLYVGEFVRGITVNLLFLFLLELFIISWSVLKFFPLIPFAVLIVAWLVFAGLAASNVSRKAEAFDEDEYVLSGYNNWLIYAGVFLLTYVAPIGLSVQFATQNLWNLERVETAGMYPTLEPTDATLIDLNAFRLRAPQRGEVVAVRPPDENRLRFLRVVGVKGDMIRMEGDTLFVNEEPVGQAPLEDASAALDDQSEANLLAQVEFNQDRRYVISVSPKAFTDMTMNPVKIGPKEFFLLADNRDKIPVGKASRKIRDSRNFGVVEADQLVGVPMYIAWSTDAESGDIRWSRIGLKVQ
ncbi:MAG: signal peptidase I [Myxococcota bacterium]